MRLEDLTFLERCWGSLTAPTTVSSTVTRTCSWTTRCCLWSLAPRRRTLPRRSRLTVRVSVEINAEFPGGVTANGQCLLNERT
jgi:hypothetical protein